MTEWSIMGWAINKVKKSLIYLMTVFHSELESRHQILLSLGWCEHSGWGMKMFVLNDPGWVPSPVKPEEPCWCVKAQDEISPRDIFISTPSVCWESWELSCEPEAGSPSPVEGICSPGTLCPRPHSCCCSFGSQQSSNRDI